MGDVPRARGGAIDGRASPRAAREPSARTRGVTICPPTLVTLLLAVGIAGAIFVVLAWTALFAIRAPRGGRARRPPRHTANQAHGFVQGAGYGRAARRRRRAPRRRRGAGGARRETREKETGGDDGGDHARRRLRACVSGLRWAFPRKSRLKARRDGAGAGVSFSAPDARRRGRYGLRLDGVPRRRLGGGRVPRDVRGRRREGVRGETARTNGTRCRRNRGREGEPGGGREEERRRRRCVVDGSFSGVDVDERDVGTSNGTRWVARPPTPSGRSERSR